MSAQVAIGSVWRHFLNTDPEFDATVQAIIEHESGRWVVFTVAGSAPAVDRLPYFVQRWSEVAV